MTQPNKPYAGYQQATSYSASIDRNIINATALHQDRDARNGIFPSSNVIQNVDFWVLMTGGWNISVAHGQCMVDGYTVIVPADVTLAVDPATSTARRDLVVVRVYDTEKGDAKTDCAVEVIKGTTTGDPTIPPRAIVVDQIDIPANAVALTQGMSFDRRTWTTAHGGVLRLLSEPIPKVPDGQLVYQPLIDRLNYVKAGVLKPIGPELLGAWAASNISGGVQGPNSVYDPVVINAVLPASKWTQVAVAINLKPPAQTNTIAGSISLYVAGQLITGAYRYHNQGAGDCHAFVGAVVPDCGSNPEIRVRNTTDAGVSNVNNNTWSVTASAFGQK